MHLEYLKTIAFCKQPVIINILQQKINMWERGLTLGAGVLLTSAVTQTKNAVAIFQLRKYYYNCYIRWQCVCRLR